MSNKNWRTALNLFVMVGLGVLFSGVFLMETLPGYTGQAMIVAGGAAVILYASWHMWRATRDMFTPNREELEDAYRELVQRYPSPTVADPNFRSLQRMENVMSAASDNLDRVMRDLDRTLDNVFQGGASFNYVSQVTVVLVPVLSMTRDGIMTAKRRFEEATGHPANQLRCRQKDLAEITKWSCGAGMYVGFGDTLCDLLLQPHPTPNHGLPYLCYIGDDAKRPQTAAEPAPQTPPTESLRRFDI